MTIQTLFRVQCDPCERYLSHDSYPKPVIADSPASPLFIDFSSAYAEAIRRGWSAFPLICPECAAEWREKVLGEQVRRGRNPEEDGRGVPESGQSAE